MSISVGTPITFPETAVAGDVITKTIVVTGAPHVQPDESALATVTFELAGTTQTGDVTVVQQVAQAVPVVTVDDVPGVDLEVVSVEPKPTTIDQWNVTISATKL